MLFKVDESLNPFFEFTGKELYVRARVVNSEGQIAWTEPIFPK